MANQRAQSRMLMILAQLFSGQTLTAAKVATDYSVSTRTAQRDLDQLQDMRAPGETAFVTRSDSRPARYYIENLATVDPGIVLMAEKMLLDTRGLDPTELAQMLEALQKLAPRAEGVRLARAVHEEVANYQPLISNQPRADLLWKLQKAIDHQRVIIFDYVERANAYHASLEQLTAVPLAISFSKQYFRVTVQMVQSGAVRDLHLDWITHYEYAKEQIAPVLQAPAVGVNRRIDAYGYRGKTVHITFEYYGLMEYVQDQFATAKVVAVVDKPNPYPFPVSLVSVDVAYSGGVRMWLITQSPILKVVSPAWVAEEVKTCLKDALARYDDADKKRSKK